MASLKSAMAASVSPFSCRSRPAGCMPTAERTALYIVGIEPDGLGEVGDGLVVFLLVRTRRASVEVGHGVAWVEPDGLVVVGDGLLVFLLRGPALTPAEVGGGPWRDSNGLRQVGDRLVVLVLALEHVASNGIDHSIRGSDLDGLHEFGDRLRPLAQVFPDLGAFDMRRQMPFVALDHLGVKVDRPVEPDDILGLDPATDAIRGELDPIAIDAVNRVDAEEVIDDDAIAVHQRGGILDHRLLADPGLRNLAGRRIRRLRGRLRLEQPTATPSETTPTIATRIAATTCVSRIIAMLLNTPLVSSAAAAGRAAGRDPHRRADRGT